MPGEHWNSPRSEVARKEWEWAIGWQMVYLIKGLRNSYVNSPHSVTGVCTRMKTFKWRILTLKAIRLGWPRGQSVPHGMSACYMESVDWLEGNHPQWRGNFLFFPCSHVQWTRDIAIRFCINCQGNMNFHIYRGYEFQPQILFNLGLHV